MLFQADQIDFAHVLISIIQRETGLDLTEEAGYTTPSDPKLLIDHIISSVTPIHHQGLCVDAVKSALESCVVHVACGIGLFTRQMAPYVERPIGLDQRDLKLEIAIC